MRVAHALLAMLLRVHFIVCPVLLQPFLLIAHVCPLHCLLCRLDFPAGYSVKQLSELCEALSDAADCLPQLRHLSIGMELDALLSSGQGAGLTPLAGCTQLTSISLVEYQVRRKEQKGSMGGWVGGWAGVVVLIGVTSRGLLQHSHSSKNRSKQVCRMQQAGSFMDCVTQFDQRGTARALCHCKALQLPYAVTACWDVRTGTPTTMALSTAAFYQPVVALTAADAFIASPAAAVVHAPRQPRA